MAIVQNWLPPSRENWELVMQIWQLFPVVTGLQWVLDWYPQGKTSNNSPLNLPGRWAWLTMEAPGFLTLLYIMNMLPKELGIEELAWGNWTMAGLFTIHYLYRAIAFPLIQPSMSPIHLFVWFFALIFQLTNATCIGGWLAGYGPVTPHDWAGRLYTIQIGMVIWGWGLLANMFHDDDLREIRRASERQQRKKAEEAAKQTGKDVSETIVNVEKVYMMPKNGLFRWVLYAHYLCEWVEWAGFWMVGGWDCLPARQFLINEIATMLPRAVQGKRWYIKKFGADKVGSRKAVIPGLI